MKSWNKPNIFIEKQVHRNVTWPNGELIQGQPAR